MEFEIWSMSVVDPGGGSGRPSSSIGPDSEKNKLTGLHFFHARVLVIFIVFISRVYL